MAPKELFKSGPFKGVDVHDTFALAALEQEPVTVRLGRIEWPEGLAPAPAPLGNYAPGARVNEPLSAKADALIILYTEPETAALLDVFTQNAEWSPARRKQWCGYAHNFDEFKPLIAGIDGDNALEQGLFGYLSALTIAGKTLVLYKSELHPKQNGAKLPFVPVIRQLITELKPGLVLSTGTAGAIGGKLNCGDVAITSSARFKCEVRYPNEPDIDTLSANHTALSNHVAVNPRYIDYAAKNLTQLALDGLQQCYGKLQELPGYGFVRKNTAAPAIYVTNQSPVPGPEPMAIVSADYLTVDDNHDSEGLQALGIMNDTDDAFVFYAISTMAGTKPAWLSVRNASEPQIAAKPFPAGTPPQTVVNDLKATAGTIYGIYQYCTTLCSAFACWGVVAGL